MQSAFVFIKPHANKPPVQALVKDKFAGLGIEILDEGEIDGAEIDSKQYIDQHYYAIASKATIMTPDKLNIPTEKFSGCFGEEWSAVLAEGRAFNALGLKKELGLEAKELDALWDATSVDKKTRIKFGGGFYCGQIEHGGKKYYTFNAFFMSMRGKFTTPGETIHFYVVQFEPAKLSWADFRGKVLGPTNPAEAPPDSLRGTLMSGWEGLGLAAAPNTGDNGVHASASPFEGLAERTNWLARKIADDPFGKALLEAGLPEALIKDWCVDPQVKIDADGKKGSLFDQLEDMDLAPCVAKCVELKGLSEA